MHFFKYLALLPLGISAISAAPVAEEGALVVRTKPLQPTCDLTPINYFKGHTDLSVNVDLEVFVRTYSKYCKSVSKVIDTSVKVKTEVDIEVQVQVYLQILVNLRATLDAARSVWDQNHGKCTSKDLDSETQQTLVKIYADIHGFLKICQKLDPRVRSRLAAEIQLFVSAFNSFNSLSTSVVIDIQVIIEVQIKLCLQVLSALNIALNLNLDLGLGLGLNLGGRGGLGLGLGLGLGIGGR